MIANPKTCSQFLTLIYTHLPILAIYLIGYQHFYDVLSGVGLDLFQPVFHGVEGGAVIDCVGHYDAHCSFVVGLGDGLEAFLAGGVPDLHADLLAIDLYGFDLEVYALSKVGGTDGGQMGTHEVVLTEPEENICLAHPAIADDK